MDKEIKNENKIIETVEGGFNIHIIEKKHNNNNNLNDVQKKVHDKEKF